MLVNPRQRERIHPSTPIVTFALLVVLFWMAGAVLHQQYDAGYANGMYDGIGIGNKDGNTQGQYEAIVNLQQWEYSHGCVVTNGYVSLKIVRDAQGKASFACVGGGK
ncbi:MAG: hypothetical protein PVS3B3_18920 [Ktedonobacteraceae bacterium]